jgi:hypothetical protein
MSRGMPRGAAVHDNGPGLVMFTCISSSRVYSHPSQHPNVIAGRQLMKKQDVAGLNDAYDAEFSGGVTKGNDFLT